MEKSILELRGVDHVFTMGMGQKMKVLSDVNVSLYQDEIVAILGPSGSGKSTCLRILAGLLRPTDGQVLIQGETFGGPNPLVSMVFQSFALLPWLTVFENIVLALEPFDLSRNDERSRVRRVIDLVGLEGFEEAYPKELSGGMKQRVGIARALVMERPVMCLDEPFTSLDVLTAETLRAEVLKLWLSKKTATKTLVLITHNISEAALLAKRILVMGTNPGHIRVTIKNDLPYPRDEKTLGFKNLVDRIHDVITQAIIPDQPEWVPPAAAGGVIETVPPVAVPEVIGLLEFIAGRGGQADVFGLTQMLGKDFGHVLFLVKTAELFDFVDTPKNHIVLTDFGKRFIEGDVNVRKRILHEVLRGLRLAQLLEQRLRDAENYTLSFDSVIEGVKEWLPNENAEAVLDALIQWGRYGELFGYNGDTKMIYLDVGQENA
ncbi:MAG: nitrate/sulfonate/bicarbonate ABC transporter ATP-binding protein [Deltaproteobacteria bacterium]|nr:nitrate/sulfonate/bicarbonate ABC transporter ATP-binding protein [Deltaproteobacteria bacterium]